MLCGQKNGTYTVIKCVQIDTTTWVVLAERDGKDAYVSWLALDPNYTGTVSFNYGHYSMNYLDALEEFWLRVKKEIDFELIRIEEDKRF